MHTYTSHSRLKLRQFKPHLTFINLSARDKAEHSSLLCLRVHNMVPNQAPPTSTTVTESIPPLTRSTTLPTYAPRPVATDRSLLTPEDAIYQGSPPRRLTESRLPNGPNVAARIPRDRRTVRNRSASRRRKGVWKKLLWVKQSCKSDRCQVHYTFN